MVMFVFELHVYQSYKINNDLDIGTMRADPRIEDGHIIGYMSKQCSTS